MFLILSTSAIRSHGLKPSMSENSWRPRVWHGRPTSLRRSTTGPLVIATSAPRNSPSRTTECTGSAGRGRLSIRCPGPVAARTGGRISTPHASSATEASALAPQDPAERRMAVRERLFIVRQDGQRRSRVRWPVPESAPCWALSLDLSGQSSEERSELTLGTKRIQTISDSRLDARPGPPQPSPLFSGAASVLGPPRPV